MNALLNAIRKLIRPPALQPVPVRAREWINRTRCW
jgi:hypothetical protein